MIFEQNLISFKILDVLQLDQENKKIHNSKRNFEALSFRLEADTIIESKNHVYELSDNSIGFFPSSVEYTRTAKKDKLIAIHFNSISYRSNELEFFNPKNHEVFRRLFQNALDCWSAKNTAYKHETSAILCQIFAELYKENDLGQIHNSKIHNSLTYINENYLKSDFSLTAAAAKSHISDVHFRKLFKKDFGISPKQYIIKQRIQYAKALMNTGYYTLQDISEQCGYNDYKHFSVEFKKATGVSPSKYTYDYQHEF